jgi:hypothetical protein
MTINILASTYLGIITLTILHSMVSFASQNSFQIERAIVQVPVPNKRYKFNYIICTKNEGFYQVSGQTKQLENFDSTSMPIYLVDYNLNELTSIKEDPNIPLTIKDETNKILNALSSSYLKPFISMLQMN